MVLRPFGGRDFALIVEVIEGELVNSMSAQNASPLFVELMDLAEKRTLLHVYVKRLKSTHLPRLATAPYRVQQARGVQLAPGQWRPT